MGGDGAVKHLRQILRRPSIVLALVLSYWAAAGAATITVNSTADVVADDGWCTLREAATAINTQTPSGALPGECAAGDGADDLVLFALAPGSTIVANALPFVFERGVEIRGPGADQLLVAMGGIERVLIFDGTSADHDFTLRGLTISGGHAATDHQGRFDRSGGGLAAIQVTTLTLRDVAFVNNSAELFGGGVALELRPPDGTAMIEDSRFEDNSVYPTMGGGGGGLAWLGTSGSLEINRSLFAGNRALSLASQAAEDADGGALLLGQVVGGLAIVNSTFSGNRASGEGGAIAFGSTLASINPEIGGWIVLSTIVDNHADIDGDSTVASGGGLHTTRNLGGYALALVSTIVANNTDSSQATPPGPDVVATIPTLYGASYNWIGIRAGAGDVFPAGQPNAQENWVGTLANPLDPQLGPLTNNGGPSRTHLPIASPLSPVIDAATCAFEGGGADQRGWRNLTTNVRIFDVPGAPNASDGCDIGAVEAGLRAPEIFADGFESAGTDGRRQPIDALPEFEGNTERTLSA